MTTNLLVVDDDQALCSFVIDGLGREGLSVRSSTAALEALEIIAAGSVDIVLVDINMPGMNGLELCRRILDSRPDLVW